MAKNIAVLGLLLARQQGAVVASEDVSLSNATIAARQRRLDSACDDCDDCVAVPGNKQANDVQCEPCAGGKQSWWPCNRDGLCQCAEEQEEEEEESINPCSDCDGCHAVPANQNGATDDACRPCANNAQAFWPCDRSDLCECSVSTVEDTSLVAYWDRGGCGPHGDNHNWKWCERREFNCATEVSTAHCGSGFAALVSTQGDGSRWSITIDGCRYAYFAEYQCTETTLPTTTTTTMTATTMTTTTATPTRTTLPTTASPLTTLPPTTVSSLDAGDGTATTLQKRATTSNKMPTTSLQERSAAETTTSQIMNLQEGETPEENEANEGGSALQGGSLPGGEALSGGVLNVSMKVVDNICDRFLTVAGLASEQELRAVLHRNCDKVKRFHHDIDNYTATGKTGGATQEAVWAGRSRQAQDMCNQASYMFGSGTTFEAAALAANAWGSVIMNGAECCTLSGPPFCQSTGNEWRSLVTLSILLAVLIGLVIHTLATNLMKPAAAEAEQLAKKEQADATSASSSTVMMLTGSPTVKRRGIELPPADPERIEQLEEMWMRSSCLRVLPQARDFAKSSASLFAALHEAFDFQVDNVRNQYEHLLSMWRSHCAMVADRSIGDDLRVNEDQLLAEALGDLYADLLDGFRCWHTNLAQHLAAAMEGYDEAILPRMGGANWMHIKSSKLAEADANHLSLQLAQVATYLLVWGEAGNLRFMPEVIYFITDMALAAQVESHDGDVAQDEGQMPPSGLFLAKIVRPIYNTIFDEWYDYVDIDASGKDKKKLHKGLEAFLPADVANYDDWNELFCDPARLTDRLVLKDGSRFFALPPPKRFAALAQVNWKESLKSLETKTHREIHSLWGVFAATHRIWLIHFVFFLVGMCILMDGSAVDSTLDVLKWPRHAGNLAALGLIVPAHSMLWLFARWQVTGRAFRWRRYCSRMDIVWTMILMTPLASYCALMYFYQDGRAFAITVLLPIHYAFAAVGLGYLLLVPSQNEDDLKWRLTEVPWSKRFVRYLFWFVVLAIKFMTGLIVINAMCNAVKDLMIAPEGHEAPKDFGYISLVFRAKSYPLMRWLQLWAVTFFFYVSDTQLWFTLCATFLGIAIVFMQRGCRCASFIFEDAVAKIPERFSQLVIPYVPIPDALKTKKFNREFALLWDRIVQYMRYEDDIDHETMGNLTFASRKDTAEHISFGSLSRELRVTDCKHVAAWKNHELCTSGCGFLVQSGLDLSGRPYRTCCKSCAERPGRKDLRHDKNCSSRAAESLGRGQIRKGRDLPAAAGRVAAGEELMHMKLPGIFQHRGFCEILWQTYGCVPNRDWPNNPDVQWRILALARGLGLPMPRPFRAPYIPGLTVLIPHYAESIIMHRADLYEDLAKDRADGMLIDFLKHRWNDEFHAFTVRMQETMGHWPAESGGQWDQYTTDAQWRKLGGWCSMRMQTLWRTVAGMCMYHPALQCHYEVQAAQSGSARSVMTAPGVWNPSDCFTCLVSMQMYKYFNKEKFEDTNRMFEKFPDCLKVAFIDSDLKGANSKRDSVHPMQKRRYYSCLIDKYCEDLPDGRKKPVYKIELPGYPILGDGKGDNQNHAIPFMRGTFAQCIDANQGAYFEQMLLLPCVLGEFRSAKRGDSNIKKIVGFPEHITSDIGSVGDMAASAELAFGTILQRTYAVLGGRMHYGHPDIMSKSYMMQQGGVSKATKTINLSEDIFAGMDFTLRGEGRSIHHAEYFHLAKGRDLGFNTVLGFFSKLASGSGEQILTRQMFRLGQILHLPECLTFFYAHVGYYFNQFFVSWSLPLLVHVWLLVLLADCEHSFQDFQDCNTERNRSLTADIMARAFSVWFSMLLFLFLIATSLPLVLELWMQKNLKSAVEKLFMQLFTLSPLLFIFQAKVIGSYVVNELRLGGAQYVNTGRGLPTERRPFLGELKRDDRGRLRIKKWGGLYLDYASIAYYDGGALLVGSLLVQVAGGTDGDPNGFTGQLTWLWIAIALLITSWLFAPFIYNPHQFRCQHFIDDVRCWFAFFIPNRGKNWTQWFENCQLRLDAGRRVPVDISIFFLCFFVLTWYELFSSKVEAFSNVYSEASRASALRKLAFLPPIAGSLTLCILLLAIERVVAGISFGWQWLWWRHTAAESASGSADVERPAEETDSHASGPQWHVRQTPLIVVSVGVMVADIAESTIALKDFGWVEWKRAFIAGMIFKYALLSTILCLSEEVLRSSCFQRAQNSCQLLKVFVYAHRMARDLVISFFILVALSPCVLLDSLNSCCCHGFSVHHLLIYRDPGRLARENLNVPLHRGRTQFWRSGISFWNTTERSEVEQSDTTELRNTKSRFLSEKEATDDTEIDLIGARGMFYDATDAEFTADVGEEGLTEMPGSTSRRAGSRCKIVDIDGTMDAISAAMV